jgi:hypothetical protein
VNSESSQLLPLLVGFDAELKSKAMIWGSVLLLLPVFAVGRRSPSSSMSATQRGSTLHSYARQISQSNNQSL